jgi:hypothetical protein
MSRDRLKEQCAIVVISSLVSMSLFIVKFDCPLSSVAMPCDLQLSVDYAFLGR